MLRNTFALSIGLFIAMFIALFMSTGMANASEENLILDIAFERHIPVVAGIDHLQSMNRKVQVDFNKRTSISLENGWVLEVTANDGGTGTELTLTVLDSARPDATVLATPHLLAPLDQVSMVRWTKDEEKLSISVKPLQPGSVL
jgi:hypothetical protein